MPRLLQVNASLNKGSTGRIAEQIATLARHRGWDTYIVHGSRYVNESAMHTLQSVTPMGERLHAVRSMLFDAHGLGSACATRRVIRDIQRIQPDVIHLHNIHGYYLNYKLLFRYLQTLDIPVVWTLHDCWPMTGHCSHFDMAGCDRWKSHCHSCPLQKDYPKSLFFDRSRRNYALKKALFTSLPNVTIVPVSQWLGRVVSQSYLGQYPSVVINNGVDLSVFAPRPSDLRSRLGLDGKKVLLGVATAWKAEKGLQDYLSLSRQLPDEYRIVLVGVSEEQQRLLPDGMIGVTRTESQTELASYYSMADVVLNLSYQETFGMTTVEGFACGTPSIVYDRTASPELIDDDCGKVVQAGNLEQLLAAIADVTSHDKSHYADACRRRAVTYYNKEDRFADYVQLYETLLRNA